MGDELPSVRAWHRRMKRVPVNGLSTAVIDAGVGDPVVFLHGIPTQAFVWRDVLDVVGRGYRTIAPDLLGFGFADRPLHEDLSPVGQAKFVTQVLDTLGIETFALVVHDYGALVGCEVIAQSPDRVSHLVVSNTCLNRKGWGGGQLTPFSLLKISVVGELAFTLARQFMLELAFRIYVDNDARLTDDVMQVYWHPFKQGFGKVLLAIARDEHGQMSDHNFHRWRAALSRFDRPALVVWGDRDPTFQTSFGREIVSMLPRGHLQIFEHSNHFIQEDRPAAFGRLIAAFLSGKFTG